jgi:hypothetical protein
VYACARVCVCVCVCVCLCQKSKTLSDLQWTTAPPKVACTDGSRTKHVVHTPRHPLSHSAVSTTTLHTKDAVVLWYYDKAFEVMLVAAIGMRASTQMQRFVVQNTHVHICIHIHSPGPFSTRDVPHPTWRAAPQAGHSPACLHAWKLKMVSTTPWCIQTSMPFYKGLWRVKDMENLCRRRTIACNIDEGKGAP